MSKLQRELEKFQRDKEKVFEQAAAQKAKTILKKESRLAQPTEGDRKGPPGGFPLLIRRALDTLQREARPLTLQELRDAAEKEHVKWLDKEFWDLLRSNEKVEDLDGGERVTYKARFVARDKAELAALLAKRVEGTRMGQLLDCYPGDVEGVRVRADVAALQAEGALYALPNAESKEDVLYPRDAAYDVPVDQRLRDMWAFMEVPSDPAALRRELQRCGIQPAVRRAARRPLPPSKEDRKKKRKRDFSKLHVTNVHLWDELFANKTLETADALD